MDITITKDQYYTRDDLDRSIECMESHATIHHADKENLNADDVINHMPYNSGKFFEKTLNDEKFLKKSLINDINFSKEIFG